MSVRFALIKKQLEIPFPIYLSGYFSRKDPATGIHDPLNISCFYVENDDKAVAVFALDILGIYRDHHELFVNGVKEKINRPNLQLLFNCAHTHSSPGFRDDEGEQSINLDVFMAEIIAKAVAILEEAPLVAKEASLCYGARLIRGVGANRREKDVEVNTILRTLSFSFNEQRAVVVNFNCHPTHMNYRNLLITKDFQGAAMDELASQGYLPMFLQGACGDISTRFTRVEQSFEDMARIGHLFAEEIKNQPVTQELVIDDFSYQEHIIKINKKAYQSEEYYLAEIEKHKKNLEAARESMSPADLRILETAVEGITVEYHFSKLQNEIVTDVRCGILRLGDKIAMVFLPFELFSKIADQITDNSIIPYTMIMGYTFDGLGYLPDQASYDASGYEVLSCTYEKGSGELIGTKVVELLNQTS